jgi:hypothetical protein
MLTRKLAIITLFTMTVASLSAQDTSPLISTQPAFYFGPLFSYQVSLLSPEGEVEGGFRSGAGAVVSIPFSKKSELRVHAMYRVESGQFTTLQDTNNVNAGIDGNRKPANGSIQVITPGTAPYISSDITIRSIELAVSYWLRIVAIDSMGTNIYVGAGLFADRLLSGEQTDDYAFADIPATDPVVRTYTFDGQFGGGGFLGGSMVFPLGNARLGFDVTYALRLPSELEGQNIEWLNGRCLRLAVHYDFAL